MDDKKIRWRTVANIIVAILIAVTFCLMQNRINMLEERVSSLEYAEEQRMLSDLKKINEQLDSIHEKLQQRGGL